MKIYEALGHFGKGKGWTGGIVMFVTTAWISAGFALVAPVPAKAAVCNAATLKGSFGMSIYAPTGPGVGIGIMSFDGVSKLTGSESAVLTGVVSNSTEAGTYSVNSSCVVTMNIDVYSNGVLSAESVYVGVIINNGSIKINAIPASISSGKVSPVLEVFEKLE